MPPPGDAEALQRHDITVATSMSGLTLAVPQQRLGDRLATWGIWLLPTNLLLCGAFLEHPAVMMPVMATLNAAAALMIVSGLLLTWRPRARQRVTLTAQALVTPTWSMPLEEIHAIASETRWSRSWLQVTSQQGDTRELEVPNEAAGGDLGALILARAQRRRSALQAAGHDITRPTRPPAALAAIKPTRR